MDPCVYTLARAAFVRYLYNYFLSDISVSLSGSTYKGLPDICHVSSKITAQHSMINRNCTRRENKRRIEQFTKDTKTLRSTQLQCHCIKMNGKS